MLTSIRLENFKSWQELAIPLAPITLLFGTNSSGKSSILQALLMLKQTVNSFDRSQRLNFGGGDRDYVDLGNFRDLAYKHQEDILIGLNMEWFSTASTKNAYYYLRNKNDLINKFFYNVSWKLDRHKNVIIPEVYYKQISTVDIEDAYLLNISKKGKYILTRKSKFRNIDEVLKRNKSLVNLYSCYDIEYKSLFYDSKRVNKHDFINLQHLSNIKISLEELLDSLHYLGPLRSHPRRNYLWRNSTPHLIEPSGENTIELLIASVRKDQTLLNEVKTWMIQLGLIQDLKLEALDKDKRFYQVQVKVGDSYSALLDVGFGISQVLPVITLLFFAPEGSILLLEQPELHLHPSAQSVLADLMLYVAETRKLQLIVESHSEHLLTRLQRRVAESENGFATPDTVKAYFCHMTDQGAQIEDVQIDHYGQIQNYPEKFFGDSSGDLSALTRAALARRRVELKRDQA